MPRKKTSSRPVIKQLRDGWYYRLGSGVMYAWQGPLKTRRDAAWLRGEALDGLIELFDELAQRLDKKRRSKRRT